MIDRHCLDQLLAQQRAGASYIGARLAVAKVARMLLILRALKHRRGSHPDRLVRKRERLLLTVSRKIGNIGARKTFQGALSGLAFAFSVVRRASNSFASLSVQNESIDWFSELTAH